MSSHKIVTERQMEILLTFMEENRGFAVGMVGNSYVDKQQMVKRWDVLASSLNAAGAAKSGNKWRDYWSEKKYEVRRKAAEVRGAAGGIGSMTPTENRILRILAKSTQPEISSQEVSSTTDEPTPFEAHRHVCNAAYHQHGHHCPDTSLAE